MVKLQFQYTDHTVWEGPPEDAHESPDKGVIRMVVTDDHDYVLEFVYQDIYYLYPEYGEGDGWLFGACTPWREFIIRPGVAGCDGKQRPFNLPVYAVVRHGETVSQEEAVKFGLIATVDEKVLHEKKRIEVNRCKDCD